MLFIHIGLLAGLAAVAVPIAIHLWSQRRRQRVAWAAVRFLKRSVDVRKRKVEFEDALLMATRCLLVALVALAVARPFIPDSSRVPWALVLPMGIAAICGLGITVAVWRNPSLRVIFLPITLVALLVCAGLLLFERNLNEKRLGAAGKQDIAIIVDASMSMTAGVGPGGDGGNFAAALEEARALAGGAAGGDPMAVILAGTVPEELTAGLVRDRGAIDAALGAARPTSGRMAALAAIENAVSLLEEGVQPGKKIVMFSDGQAQGWQLDQPALWQALDERLAQMPSPPQLILRRFGFPEPFRNAAVARIDFEPEMLMVNQTSTITVVVENTGEQAITPNALEIEVDGSPVPQVLMDQIAPGESRKIPVSYRFDRAGPVTVTAELVTQDDIAGDNRTATVGFVRPALQVLVVDGRPFGPPLDRAAAFLALALDSASPGGGASRGVQISPEVVTAEEFNARPSLDGFGVVALCEVDLLADQAASRLAAFVAGGGGLIIAPGESLDLGFYNTWRHRAEPFLPAEIGASQRLSMINDKLGPQPASFQNTIFEFLADDEQSDISAMLVARYRKLEKRAGAGELGILRNGDPLFLTREIGDGTVFVSAVAFRPDASNLVTREIFLPLVQELILSIAGASLVNLALDPAPGMALSLPTVAPIPGALPDTVPITAASGDQIDAELSNTPGGIAATWTWDGISGLHDLRLPDQVGSALPDRMIGEDGALRFSIGPELGESRKNLLSDGDREVIAGHLDLIEAAGLEEVRGVLSGQPVGEELWRKLIIAALILLVLESALARYITRQRRVGRRDGVNFGMPAPAAGGGAPGGGR